MNQRVSCNGQKLPIDGPKCYYEKQLIVMGASFWLDAIASDIVIIGNFFIQKKVKFTQNWAIFAIIFKPNSENALIQ